MRSICVLVLLLTAAAAQGETLRNIDTPSGGAHYDKYGSAAVDRDGRFWIAWTSMRGGKDEIVVRSRSGSVWSEEERLDRGEGVESTPKLIVDARGRVIAVWHGRRNGKWAVYTRTGIGRGWSSERTLSAQSVDALHPAVAMDRQNRLWIAWEIARPGGFAVQLISENGGGWSRPATILSSGSDRRPSLAAAEKGIWIGWDSTRSGNYDIWLANAIASGQQPPRIETPMQVTRHATIDDSPSLASSSDGTLWVAWNGMRGHASDEFRADRHSGDAFVRVLRDRQWLTPPAAWAGALPGQVSFGAVSKTPRDAVPPYWQWKQTQNYPVVALDGENRAWILWRTDATGAHNFDLWGRVHDGERWSPELHLTTFSPGRDEWPSFARDAGGALHLVWEGQVLPKKGEESKYLGGDVDAYNTLGLPNVILTGSLHAPSEGWTIAPLSASQDDAYKALDANEPMFPGPSPRTARSRDGKWGIFFGDPHSHTILSDARPVCRTRSFSSRAIDWASTTRS